jgi:hypothetical protein
MAGSDRVYLLQSNSVFNSIFAVILFRYFFGTCPQRLIPGRHEARLTARRAWRQRDGKVGIRPGRRVISGAGTETWHERAMLWRRAGDRDGRGNNRLSRW